MNDYAGRSKYDAPGRAERYKDRSKRRDAEEWALLARVLDGLERPPEDAWDVPCGTGRIAEQLIQRGIPTRCGDLSPAMLAATGARLAGEQAYGGAAPVDLESVPDTVVPADLVICFRFLHHLPSAAHRMRVLRGLRALTRHDLLLSFHHPVSLHNLDRAFKRLLLGRRGDRYTITRGQLVQEATEAGFTCVGAHPLARYRRELWVLHLRPST